MPWPTDQRDRTRSRILESASRLFADKGYEQVCIDDLMADAGLTRGAFYSHFQTKAELYAQAIRYAASTGGARLQELGKGGIGALVEGYLQRSHATGESMRCPLAFMAADITQREPEIRQVYSTALQNFIARLQQASPTSERTQILQMVVALIGGLVLARAVEEPDLSEEILAACRSDCHGLLAQQHLAMSEHSG
ncbi:TetR/AcrR family transcriptional regulator [Stutzerimonas kunmingensis]|uniref:TetR/AcrR family transcriptional regulator n=1 Tax=Stutzerimonas kunmingensis TaxID=1211807 RepID=UPI0028A8AB89|nr:TetR/AcrR family transcriptional regulator [Stutzerimonas kunmingensis]